MIAEGVGCVEIKSGYGLEIETELRMLRLARQIGQARSIRVRTSYLGAHAIPTEFHNQSDQYLEQVALPAMRAGHAEGLIDAVDGFCENIAFSAEQIERVFKQAKALGLPVKLHAEQLSNQGGSVLAARYNAMSADHLEYLDTEGVVAMAKAGTVAVLLPGAYYFLRETQLPPIQLLRSHQVPIAVATDCNPGSSPLTSMLLALNMACTLFRLTPEEALAGATRHAAAALGLKDCGVLAPGMRADLAIWNINHPAELAYRIGFNPLHERHVGASRS
jgi:imidazolonepropionase